ncbi:uncharacterized protein CC84DRAFT_1051004, partial [Paraphaeosphaeria sporulosa]
SNTILWYFYNSPWFDQGSNNNSLLRQVGGTPQQELLFNNRVAFEERMRTDYPYGTQYVVAYEPKNEGEPWVIQRQEKSVDQETGRTAKTEVTATYYTQGTRIFMAKSLLDVLQTRLLSVSTQLQDLMELSQGLSHFSPATGHTYVPPSFDLAKASSASRGGSRAGSRTGSPVPDQSSQSQSQTQPGAQPTAADPFETFSDAFFLRSLDRTEAYFEEYVDENPLQGEPGSFVLTHSWRNTVTRREEDKKRAEQAAAQQAAAAQAAAQPTQLSISTSQTQSGLQSSTSTPKPATPATESFSRKASIASQPKPGKEKRRKSKGPGSLASPVTPTGP